MANALTGMALYANNQIVEHMPNSLKFITGRPERVVTSQVVGDGRTSNVVTENFETSKGKVMFDLKTTVENVALVDTWTSNVDQNVFKCVATNGTAYIFQGAVVINQPEIDTGSDGVMSIEVESEQAVFA